MSRICGQPYWTEFPNPKDRFYPDRERNVCVKPPLHRGQHEGPKSDLEGPYTTSLDFHHRFPIGARVVLKERIRVIDGIKITYAGPSYYGHYTDNRQEWQERIKYVDEIYRWAPKRPRKKVAA